MTGSLWNRDPDDGRLFTVIQGPDDTVSFYRVDLKTRRLCCITMKWWESLRFAKE